MVAAWKLIAPAKQVLFNLKFICIMNRSRDHELDLFSEDMRLVFGKHSHWNFVAFFFVQVLGVSGSLATIWNKEPSEIFLQHSGYRDSQSEASRKT